MSIVWLIDKSKLETQFAADIDGLLRADVSAWAIHYGFRSAAEQEHLWEEGRELPGPIVTNAKPGHSPHEFGEAVDFHQLLDGKDSYAVNDDWRRIMAQVDAHPRLHGGWHFPEPDDDHIQSLTWYKTRLALQQAGKW